MNNSLAPIQIGADPRQHARLGLGTSFYGIADWRSHEVNVLLETMASAIEHGITHFDTAEGYGGGESESLIGRFLRQNDKLREKVFLASKAHVREISQQAILNAIEGSRQRLQTDVIDLYYIHWPHTGKDLRPLMEGLELARAQGKIRSIGVSNFSIAQMQQVAEVGVIDAQQLGYNLLWRFPERDLLPYCQAQGITTVIYSALAHGILAGKYARGLTFPPHDQRWSIALFRDDVWHPVYEIVEQFKALADQVKRPLLHLALRWLLVQPFVSAVLVSAKSPKQVEVNGQSLTGDIPQWVFDELDRLSAAAAKFIPDEGNPFGYHP